MYKRLSHGDINLKLNDRGIIIGDGYTNMKTKTEFQCLMGHKWEAVPNNVVNGGGGCPNCYRNDSYLTKDKFNMIIFPRGIKITGEYINIRTKTQFSCVHGHSWLASPHHVKNSGSGCPECEIRQSEWTKEEINFILKSREIEISGPYYNMATTTEFTSKCGHQWQATPNNVLNMGTGCPHCAEYGFNPSKPAWGYGFTRDNYLKVGITNNLNQRLNQHRVYVEINLVYENYYPVGQMALDWENQIKKIHGGSFVTKEKCPDGYTETFPAHLVELLDINTYKPLACMDHQQTRQCSQPVEP